MTDLEQKRSEVRQRLIDENEFPNIPKNWGVERLRFLFKESKERNGGSPVGEMLSVSEYRGVVPREYDNEEQKRTDDELENYRVVRPGQLAVNSMWLNHLGLGVSEHTGHVSPAYNVYDISCRLDRRFVHHLLRSNYYLKIYLRYLYGIRPNSFQIKSNDWASIPITLPDLSTQREIADFLDRETARIDLLIEKKQKLVALLGEKRHALINELSTVGTNLGVRYRTTDAFWFPKVPEKWQSLSANRIFAERKGRALNGEKQLTASQKYGMIFQEDFIQREGHKVTQVISGSEILKHAEPGDYIISMRSFQGGLEYNPYRGSMSSAYVAVYPITKIDNKYFKYLFKSQGFIKALQMTSNLVRDGQALRYANFRQVNIPVPPIQEQKEIGMILDKKLNHIGGVIEAVSKSIDFLKKYRSALITAAVTGQIDVTTYAKSGATDRRLDAIQEEMGA